DTTRYLGLHFDWADKKTEGISNKMTFGLDAITPSDPKKTPKRLTFALRGQTNSSVLLIDGRERGFGDLEHGRWEDKPVRQGKYAGLAATFAFSSEQVLVTQRAEIVPGEAVEITPEVYRRLLDTCLVRYTIKNRDSKPHKVGLRFVRDT